MKIRVVFGAMLLLLSALVGIHATAGAEQLGAPVELASCSLDWHVPANVPDDSLEPPAVIYGVDVRFTNVAPVAADEITLRVKYNGKVATMHDFGKFQQGVQIDHTLTHLPIDEYDGDDSSCRLTAVHFVNGTSWYAAAPRRQSTTDAEQPSR